MLLKCFLGMLYSVKPLWTFKQGPLFHTQRQPIRLSSVSMISYIHTLLFTFKDRKPFKKDPIHTFITLTNFQNKLNMPTRYEVLKNGNYRLSKNSKNTASRSGIFFNQCISSNHPYNVHNALLSVC